MDVAPYFEIQIFFFSFRFFQKCLQSAPAALLYSTLVHCATAEAPKQHLHFIQLENLPTNFSYYLLLLLLRRP